jgi:hypothetical protein
MVARVCDGVTAAPGPSILTPACQKGRGTATSHSPGTETKSRKATDKKFQSFRNFHVWRSSILKRLCYALMKILIFIHMYSHEYLDTQYSL